MSGADTASKEVIQTDKILVFSFISNLDVFDLSHVSLSEHKCQDPRCASVFLLLVDQYTGWVLKFAASVEN